MKPIELPAQVPAGEFSAERRRADRSRTFWASSARGTVLQRWDALDGAWSDTSETTTASWEHAVAADRDLVAIRTDELTEFTAPSSETLLDLLRVAGDGDPDDVAWTFDVADWEGADEDFVFAEDQVQCYASINGKRVPFLLTDQKPVAVLVEDGDLLGASQIGHLVWNSEGDPASAYLFSARSSVAVGLERSEMSQQVRGFRHGTDPHGQAQMLREWLLFFDGFGTGGGAATVALEPFDPNATLTAEKRAEWDVALAEQCDGWDYTFRVSFDAPDVIKDELRKILASEDPGFVAVRDAFAHPIHGEWLLQQLSTGRTDALW